MHTAVLGWLVGQLSFTTRYLTNGDSKATCPATAVKTTTVSVG